MNHICRFITALFVALAFASPRGEAQIVRTDANVSSDSIRKAFDDGPYFGLYKDNYFIFGT